MGSLLTSGTTDDQGRPGDELTNGYIPAVTAANSCTDSLYDIV
jgi:hypothetical protein